jgi:hypothetical protein
MHKRILFLAFLLAAAANALAAIPKVHIVGSLYDPRGQVPRNVTIRVQSSGPFTVTDTTTTGIVHAITGINDTINVPTPSSVNFYLIPNSGKNNLPNNTFYNVTINADGQSYTQKWQVAWTTADVQLAQIITTAPAPTSTSHLAKSGDGMLGTLTLLGDPPLIVSPTAQPSSAVTGTVYFDSTDLTFKVWDGLQWKSLGSGGGSGGSVLTISRPNITVANSSANTSIYSATIPAGTIGTAYKIKATLLSKYSNIAAGETPTVNITYGGSLVASLPIPLTNVASNDDYTLVITGVGNGSTSSQYWTVKNTLESRTDPVQYSSTTAVDSTVDQTLEISWDWQTADSGNTITSINGCIEQFAPSVTTPPSAIDHNALANLTSGDPHTQYIRTDGTRAFTGPQSFGGYEIKSVLAEKLASDPTNPVTARFWFDLSSSHWKYSSDGTTGGIIDPLDLADHIGTLTRSYISNFDHADTHDEGGGDPLDPYYLLLTGNNTMSGNLNLGFNQLINARLQNLATDPVDHHVGKLYYRTDVNYPYIDNGVSFQNIMDRTNHIGTQVRSSISDFAHASTHDPAGTDPLAVLRSWISDFAHADTHDVGGSDPLDAYYLSLAGGTVTGNIDLSFNQMTNMVIEVLASDPTAGHAGRLFWNSSLGRFRQDTGSAITDLGVGSGSVVTASPVTGNGLVGSPITLNTAAVDHNSLNNLAVGDPHTQYIPADGSRPLTGDWNLSGGLTPTFRISNSADPVDLQDLVTVNYANNTYINNNGGVLNGNIDFNHFEALNFMIEGVTGDPTPLNPTRLWADTTVPTQTIVKWYNGTDIINPLDRQWHTGTQLKSSISDFGHGETHADGDTDSISAWYVPNTGGTYTGNVSGTFNELIQWKIENRTSNPAAGNPGYIFFNTSLGRIQIDDGVTVGDVVTGLSNITYKEDGVTEDAASIFNGHGLDITVAGSTADITVRYGTNSTSACRGDDVRLNPSPGANGATIYSNGSAYVSRAIGSASQIDMVVGGIPTWTTVGGDLTNSGGTFTIANSAVTDAKLASVFIKANGTVPLSADWDAGNFTISALGLETDSILCYNSTSTIALKANAGISVQDSAGTEGQKHRILTVTTTNTSTATELTINGGSYLTIDNGTFHRYTIKAIGLGTAGTNAGKAIAIDFVVTATAAGGVASLVGAGSSSTIHAREIAGWDVTVGVTSNRVYIKGTGDNDSTVSWKAYTEEMNL